jgi:hypothetical protein
VTLAALLVAGELAGCAGIANPYQTNDTATHTTSTARARTPADVGDPTPERNGTVPPREQAAIDRVSAAAARTSPQVALTHYAQLYIDWTAPNVAASERQLAAISLGQARAQALQAAASVARDPELTRSAVSNAGHRRRDRRWARRGRRTLGARHPRADHRSGRLRRPAADPARHLRPADRHRERMGRDPMAAPELTRLRTSPSVGSHRTHREARCRRVDVRTACLCWVALAATTALGAVAAMAWPALGPATRPHATLHPSLDAIASIVLNNARVLAAPLILVAARFDRGRVSRVAGDTIVAAILAGNAIAVGVALGRWRGALIPFVPQLPVEYLAAAIAATTWLNARRHSPRPRRRSRRPSPWQRSD